MRVRTPKDAVTIHAVAKNEYRDNFDLDSIKLSNGSYINNYSVEKEFLGAHSNIGGGYANGQIQLLTLNWMIDRANNMIPKLTNKDGSKQNIYNKPGPNQQPSSEFTRRYNNYEQALSNYNQSPTIENKINLQSNEKIIRDNYTRNESWSAIWNYDIEPGREIYYPNEGYFYLKRGLLPIKSALENDNQVRNSIF